MRRIKAGKALTLVAIAALSLSYAAKADAQDAMGRRASMFDLGIYAGGAWTTDWFDSEDFNNEAGTGWLGGGSLTYWINSQLGARFDGAYVSFGSEEFGSGAATIENSLSALFASLAAQYQFSPDTSAAGGGFFPYVTAGVGLYRLSSETSCEGTCPGFTETSSSDSYFGLNLGVGATVPLSGFRTFVEVKGHNMRFDAGSGTFITATFGVKF